MTLAEKRQLRRAVRNTLIYTLRHGLIHNTANPEAVKVVLAEQAKIAKQIERDLP